MYEQFGFSNPEQFFAKYLRECADACAEHAPVFISIGSGNCHTEIEVARLLKDAGLSRFVIECLDMNRQSLRWGREMAAREGMAEHITPLLGDFNKWKADKRYTAIIANQSLHHVVNLEGLFDEVKRALDPRGFFLSSDMIGRNGHQRWPEALAEVQNFWQELPSDYRYNWQRKLHQEQFEDWDCSQIGFEGIRAQDILPLLLERFDFRLFVGCCNVIDVFIDRSFGPNFKADRQWDREFIDRLHAFDEQALIAGTLKPTHMLAAMTPQACRDQLCARGMTAQNSVRRPS